MIHCFKCGADLPDNMLYCLQCGVFLAPPEAETIVKPKYGKQYPPIPTRGEIVKDWAVETTKRGGLISLGVGGILFAFLLIYLANAGHSSVQPGTENIARNSAIPAATAPPVASSEPPPLQRIEPTPKPLPPSIAANSVANAMNRATRHETYCEIKPGEQAQLHDLCAIKDCDLDQGTIADVAMPGENVKLMGSTRQSRRKFVWTLIEYRGRMLWISNYRLSCG